MSVRNVLYSGLAAVAISLLAFGPLPTLVITPGIMAILFGCKGFTSQGLQVLDAQKSITGTQARVVGAACVILGIGIIGFAITFFLFIK